MGGGFTRPQERVGAEGDEQGIRRRAPRACPARSVRPLLAAVEQ
jgi:hypothetical protein